MPAPKASAPPRPNRALFAVLAVVLVAALIRYAVPSMFGGSTLKTVTPTILPRHFAKAPTSTVPVAAATALVRTGRNPFVPPRGH